MIILLLLLLLIIIIIIMIINLSRLGSDIVRICARESSTLARKINSFLVLELPYLNDVLTTQDLKGSKLSMGILGFMS
jgi:hypothetical protein